jgi:CHAT domain-containing protein
VRTTFSSPLFSSGTAGATLPTITKRLPFPSRPGLTHVVRWLPWTLALGVGVGAGVLFSSPAFFARFSDPLGPLRGAVGSEALGPGRFTGEFQRPANASVPDFEARLEAVRGKAGTRGVVDLLEDFPEALRGLEDQARQQPESAAAWSDLAAGYLTRGAGHESDDDPLDLLAALRAGLQATKLDPEHPEAAFNYAESLSRCGLKRQALQAWNHYLGLDPASDWTRLALDRRKRLAAPTHDKRWHEQGKPALLAALAAGDREGAREVVDRFRTRSREWLLHETFPAWGRAVAANESPTATTHRKAIVSLAEVLSELTGDELLLDAARDLPTFPPKTLELARVLARWPDAGGKLADWQATRDGLAAQGSPLAFWAAYQTERFRYNDDRGTAKYNLTRLADELGDRPYPMVRSSIAGLLGVIAGIEDDPERAADFYSAGRRLAEDSEGEIAALPFHLLDASAFDRLGRRRDAWRGVFSATRQSARVGDRYRIYGPLLTAVDTLIEADEAVLAEPFVGELLANVEGTRRPDVRSESLARAGRHAAAMGRWAEAEAHFALALEQARDVDATLAPRLEAQLRLARGSSQVTAAPAAAVADLEAALGYFQSSAYRYFEAETLMSLGGAEERLGQPQRAAERYRQALEVLFERRRGLLAAEARLFTVGRSQPAFDALMALELDGLGAGTSAFSTADRAKAVGLVEALGAKPIRDLEEVRLRLPADLALIQYATLPDRLAIWVVQRQGSEFRAVSVAREELNRGVADLRAALRTNRDLPAANARISSWLWDPVADAVAPGTRLVIVPDGTLGDVPWAGLTSEARDRPIVMDHEISVAPSVTLAMHLLNRPWQRPRNLLVVADPAFPSGDFPGLKRLPNAEMEGFDVGFRFSPASRRVLTGRSADAETFLSNAPGMELVHFAGHGIGEGESPADSALVFAAGADGTASSLPAWRIAETDWTGTRLVVLSSCQGVQSGAVGRQVLTGLASAFLSGGVPTLVASPEPVADQVTRAFMRHFHDALGAGERPAQALRTAQLQMIRSPYAERNQPKSWATWIVLGAP